MMASTRDKVITPGVELLLHRTGSERGKALVEGRVMYHRRC